MSSSVTTNTNQCMINYSGRDLTQGFVPNLFKLPQEVLRLIAHQVAQEPSALKSAIRTVEFGRVCFYTHWLTHEDEELDALIRGENKFAPLVGFLKKYLQSTPSTSVEDFYIMRTILDEKDEDSAQLKARDLFGVYFKNHPGVETEVFVNFKTERMNFMDEPANDNRKDLFKVFYTIFNKTFEVLKKEQRELPTFKFCVEKAGAVISADPAELQAFLLKIHRDMINGYAKHPLKELTIEKYNEILKEFLKLFVPSQAQFHELHLRKAICLFHDKVEFETISQEYANPGQEFLFAIKAKLEAERSEELKVVQHKIHWLCGDHFNGAINAVYWRMQNREAEMQQLKSTYNSGLMAQVQAPVSVSETIIKNQKNIDSLFQITLDLCQQDRKCFDDLKTQLSDTSGRKVDLEAGLTEEKLAVDAYLECQKISAFYTELGKPIDENNRDEAYELLHNLIGE